MKMPGYTAEASLLREVKDRYALSLGGTEEGGTVLPQLLCYSCSYNPLTGRYECGWHPCVIRARL
jgi:hypothetical protein